MDYKTIANDGIVEEEIKKSRFICHLKRISSEEEGREYIAQIKKEHQLDRESVLPTTSKQEIQFQMFLKENNKVLSLLDFYQRQYTLCNNTDLPVIANLPLSDCNIFYI